MRPAHLLLVVLALGAGVVTFSAWRGAGATARAELEERGRALVPVVVAALWESQARAKEAIEREQQRLLSVARRARLELSLPLGPARERMQRLVGEEGVRRFVLLDKQGQDTLVLSGSRVVPLRTDGSEPELEPGFSPDERKTLETLLPAGREEAWSGLTLNAFATAYSVQVAMRMQDGGALLLASAADEWEAAGRGLGAVAVLDHLRWLPDVRGIELGAGPEETITVGDAARAGDLAFRGSLPRDAAAPITFVLGLSPRRVDALAEVERARILLWGGLATGAALLSAFLLWRRERAHARQRARDEAAAREQQRLAEMGVLTGLFVHEVSNPLNALGLQLEGVKRAVGATGAEEIVKVKGTLGRVRSALESFLQVATPMEGRAGETYGVERLRRTVGDLRADSPAADLVLEVAPAAEALAVAARVPVLDQALRNLLRNALQSAPAGSSVRVAWDLEAPASVSLVVRDLGPGFPAQVLESGGALGVSGRREGHGLGLYLARRIVEGLGGRMTLANPTGGGAEVRVTLPAVNRDAGSGA